MFFITYLFISSGISIIITESIIFEKFRNTIERRSPFFGQGINCPMCTGFWVGIFLSILGISPAHLYIFPYLEGNIIPNSYVYYFMNFTDGVISSMLSWGYFNFISFLQKKHLYDYIENQLDVETDENILNG